MIMSKKSESCQMVNMTCKCKKTSENELKIQMNCVEPRLLNEILLDFNHFKIETNETIELTIEKKAYITNHFVKSKFFSQTYQYIKDQK